MYETESSRWQAIQRRDHAAASSFVYAVASTKIYCRPSCPSRLARRANICFYNVAAEAAAAGYRPCLRCLPDQPTSLVDGQQGQKDAVRRACVYIAEMNGQAKFPDVAKQVGLSTRYLYGIFKAVTGTTPAKYAQQFKSEHKPYKPYKPSEPESVMSETVNPPLETSIEQAFDNHFWSHSLFDTYGDCTILQESLGLSLPCSITLDDPLSTTSVGANCTTLEEALNILPGDPAYTYPTDFDMLNASENMLFP